MSFRIECTLCKQHGKGLRGAFVLKTLIIFLWHLIFVYIYEDQHVMFWFMYILGNDQLREIHVLITLTFQYFSMVSTSKLSSITILSRPIFGAAVNIPLGNWHPTEQCLPWSQSSTSDHSIPIVCTLRGAHVWVPAMKHDSALFQALEQRTSRWEIVVSLSLCTFLIKVINIFKFNICF